MSIGSTVRLLREARGMTQEELAHELGTSQSRVSAIESEKYGERYSLRTLNNLAAALGAELIVRFKTKGAFNESHSRSLGPQPREEIVIEQEPKESSSVKHQSGQHEMVETMFQQTVARSLARGATPMRGL